MLKDFSRRIKRNVKRSALGFAGSILLCIGVGFGTAALFILLAELRSPLVASTLIGLIYAAGGAILLAFAVRRPRPDVPPKEPLALLIDAFLNGLSAGRNTRK